MLTVADLADRYLTHLSDSVLTGQLKSATAEWYRHQFSKLKKVAGHLPAAKVTPADLAGVEFTYQFVRGVKTLFRWAVDLQLVPQNPLRKVAVPKCGQRDRTITREEMVRLYKACSRRFRLFLFVTRYTLSRPGEVRNLRWSQVDLAARVLRLREFKTKGRRGQAAERPIPIGIPAWRVLSAWHARRNPAPTDPVFPDRYGRIRSSNALRSMMRAACERAGLREDKNGERIVIYSLRHTGATEAIRNGVPQIVLANVLGHKQLETTKRYVHLNEADMLAGIDQATRRRKPQAK